MDKIKQFLFRIFLSELTKRMRIDYGEQLQMTEAQYGWQTGWNDAVSQMRRIIYK